MIFNISSIYKKIFKSKYINFSNSSKEWEGELIKSKSEKSEYLERKILKMLV